MNPSIMPPCQAACPVHMDVHEYVDAVARGDELAAVRIIHRTNPIPSVCGRICTRDCESVCRRGQKVDEPVAIRALKRFAADHALEMEPERKPEPRYSDRIAVVGSGPAGLTAAHDLAWMGYPVTVLEAEDELGGMLTRGIPRYRLPLEVVRADINRILSLGIEAKTGRILGRDFSLSDLQREYSAVFLSMGSEKSFCPDCGGLDLQGVITAVDFLKDVSRGEKPNPGERVVVIGGGHTAIDAARTSLRLGAKEVTIAYRRTVDEMPAGMDEVEHAQEEGIEFQFLTSPVEFVGTDQVERMRCVRMDLDKSCGGKGKLVCVEGSEYDIPADSIILATGYGPNTEPVQEVFDSQGGKVEIKDGSGATSVPGVFAGGDFVSGPTTVVQAMASGRKVADSIHRYLRGLAPEERADPLVLEELDERVAENVPGADREKEPAQPVRDRIRSFDEVELGFTREQAVAEAKRCLNCGLGAHVAYNCASCLNCVLVCPYGVPRPGEERAEIDISQCQACGICAGQCPVAAIDLAMDSREAARAQLREVVQRARNQAAGEFSIRYICDYAPDSRKDAESNKTFSIGKPGLGRMDVYQLLAPFEAGAREVEVVGCGEQECKFKDCSLWTRKNVERARRVLQEIGMDPERLKLMQME